MKNAMTLKEARERLRRIHGICTGNPPYSSDFGRVMSIEAISNTRLSRAELVSRGYFDEPSTRKRTRR